MRSSLIQSLLTVACILIFAAGCTIKLQSPIKISRNKEEEKTPPENVVYPEPVSAPSTPSPKAPTAAAVKKPQPVQQPHYQTAASSRSPEDILVLDEEYWPNINSTLGRVTINDVSGQGLSSSEAKRALKIEAFHRFGDQAGGLINLAFEQKSNWMGAASVAAASADVVSWADLTGPAPSQKKATHAPTASREGTSSAATSSYVPSPPTPVAVPAQQVAAPTAPPASTVSQEFSGVSSPAAVLILSDQDLVDYTFQVIGKISVFSKSGDGFDLEDANRALKAEAFRRYGSQARGIINTTYKEKSGLLNWGADTFSEASGDVVNWGESNVGTHTALSAPVQVPEPASPSSAIPSAPGAQSLESSQAPSMHREASPPSPQRAAYPPSTFNPSTILVVSPEGLVNKDIEFLGKITVKAPSGGSFDEDSAAEALKAEAYRKFGRQARGITNLDYKRKAGLINLKKYGKASAEVITWGTVEDATPPAPVPVAEGAPYYSRDEKERLPEYTAGATSHEDIRIVTANDLLHDQYETLGTVEYQSPSRYGVRSYEADTGLKRVAFNTYGSKARAIIHVEYTKATGHNTSADKVSKATGEVITW